MSILPSLRVKAHDTRGVATSLNFMKILSLDKVVEAASWRTNSVFASHYLKDVEIVYENCRALGHFIAAGNQIP